MGRCLPSHASSHPESLKRLNVFDEKTRINRTLICVYLSWSWKAHDLQTLHGNQKRNALHENYVEGEASALQALLPGGSGHGRGAEQRTGEAEADSALYSGPDCR